MASFACQTRDGTGRIVRKTIDAASRREAIALLEAAGLFPVEIKEVLRDAALDPAAHADGAATDEPSGAARTGERVDGRIRGKELLNFTIQLASSIHAGVPLLKALQSSARQTSSERFEAVLLQMCADLEAGDSLSAAMRRHPRAFPQVYASSVAAGEESGGLDEVLENLAEFLEADLELRADVRSALLYPAIVVLTLCLAVSVLIVFVVPRFAGFYTGFDSELPLPTRILVATSTAATQYFPLVLLGCAGLAYGLGRMVRSDRGRAILERVLLRVPVISRLIETSTTLRVTQMLGLFAKAGVPILQGLATIGRATMSTKTRAELALVAEGIAAGESLADSLESAECLPPTARQMLAAGESTGTLEESCAAVSRQFKKELRYLTKNLATLIEPFLTLVLAVVVLFVALAVFLPMWDMVKVVRD